MNITDSRALGISSIVVSPNSNLEQRLVVWLTIRVRLPICFLLPGPLFAFDFSFLSSSTFHLLNYCRFCAHPSWLFRRPLSLSSHLIFLLDLKPGRYIPMAMCEATTHFGSHLDCKRTRGYIDPLFAFGGGSSTSAQLRCDVVFMGCPVSSNGINQSP